MAPPRLVQRRRLVLLPLLFLLSAGCADSRGAPCALHSPQLAELLLAEDPYWLLLLHAGPAGLSRAVRSRVVSERFFIDPQGRGNPAAELRSEVARFFPPDPERQSREEICRFPLRYEWLRTRLHHEELYRPAAQLCPKLDEYLKHEAPSSLSIVYPESSLDNPATMFGHTFLMLEGSRNTAGTAVVNRTVSYGVESAGEHGLPFVLKGLGGGYRGRFTYARYDRRLEQYLDEDRRDIWEFRLALSDAERERLLLHLWELEQAEFDYYFLDENCTTHLLTLLDVARPSLHLSRSQLWVMPGDLVRRVAAEQDLVQATRYRPSAAGKLRALERTLTSEQALRARQIAAGAPAAGASAGSLEAAYLLLNEPPRSDEHERRARAVLVERAKVVDTSPTLRDPANPALGHPGGRYEAAALSDDRGARAIELGFRPAYHSTGDRPLGYPDGAELEAFHTVLRVSPERSSVELARVELLRVRNSPARGGLIRPWSWLADVGLEQWRFSSVDRRLSPYGRAGAGFTGQLGLSRITALATVQGMLSDRVPSRALAGPGTEVTLALPLSETIRWTSSASATYWPGGIDAFSLRAANELRYDLSTWHSVALFGETRRDLSSPVSELGVRFYWFRE